MNSLTHVVLGAAIGTPVLGRKVGPKAALWGAACATLPDLDVLIPYGDPVRDFTFHMTGERLSRYQYAAERDTTPEVDVDFTIPMAYGIGLGYRFWDRYQLAIDYTSQPWSTASISGQSWPEIRNGSRLGIGAERDGSRDAQASYLDRAAWRVGFTYTPTYYNPTGTPINEWSVTAGASLPIGLENRIHLAFEYGRRGTLENSLIQHTIYRFSASLAISEMWFIRSEED